MSKGFAAAYLLIIFLVLGGLLVVYYVGIQKQTSSPQQATPSASPTQSPAQRSNETANSDLVGANWKTYTNTQYGYSLKYPQNWLLREDYDDQIKEPFINIQSQPYKLNKSDTQLYEIYIRHRNITLQELKTEKNYKEEMINNYSVFRSVSYSQYWNDDVFFKIKDNDYIEINFSPYDLDNPHPNQEDAHKIFTQILSTFKFLDQTSDTTNWKTYTNTKYGYSVQYPPTWTIIETPDTSTSTAFNQVQFRARSDNGIPNLKIIIWRNNSLTKGGTPALLGGLSAQKNTNEIPTGIFHDTIFTSKGDYDYSLELEYAPADKDQYTKLFNQILSTFKFTP